MKLVLAVILGSLFGFALFYVGAASPKKIQSMLRLEDLSLMKIIVFAIGFSSVLLALSIQVGIFDITHLSIKPMHFGVVIGGLIFGVGFGLAGTCPGTCLAAAGGKGRRQALAAILGGLTGALLFAVSYDWWKGLGIFDMMDLGKRSLFVISERFPSVFSLGTGGLLVVGGLFMLIAYVIPLQGRRTKK